MNKVSLLILVALMTMVSSVLYAQNNTNSPYTRYGYGKLADQSFGSQRAMGGIGYGLRDPQKINILNPASFSNVDSMTFMFDLGVTAQMAWFKEGDKTARKINGNIEYIAMQFPLFKNMGMGIGLAPVSHVGYKYGDSKELELVDGSWQAEYSGSGGLSKVYTSLSYNLFKRLSVGLNVGYMFGDIIHNGLDQNSITASYPTLRTDTLRASGFVGELGLQFYQPLENGRSLVVGAVYSPKMKFNGTVRESQITYDSYVEFPTNAQYSVSRDSVFEMPETYGLGLTYNQEDKFTLGADVKYQKWADAKHYNQTDSLSNSLRVSLGGEYIPDFQSSNFLKRVRYRAGANYSNSYLDMHGIGYKEYGFSLGLGLPMPDRRSFINMAFEYTLLRPDESMINKTSYMVDEQYFKITLSYTFNELWFFKRKLQ